MLFRCPWQWQLLQLQVGAVKPDVWDCCGIETFIPSFCNNPGRLDSILLILLTENLTGKGMTCPKHCMWLRVCSCAPRSPHQAFSPAARQHFGPDTNLVVGPCIVGCGAASLTSPDVRSKRTCPLHAHTHSAVVTITSAPRPCLEAKSHLAKDPHPTASQL